jgi:plastocyanin
MNHLIRILSAYFNSPVITINKGDTVQWINEDMQHNHVLTCDLFNLPVLGFRDDYSLHLM